MSDEYDDLMERLAGLAGFEHQDVTTANEAIFAIKNLRAELDATKATLDDMCVLRDSYIEQLDALRKQEPVAEVRDQRWLDGRNTNEPCWISDPLPHGTKLYAAPVPPAAVADEVVSFLSHIGFALDDREEQALLAILAATPAPVAQKVLCPVCEQKATLLDMMADMTIAAAQAQEGKP